MNAVFFSDPDKIICTMEQQIWAEGIGESE